MNVLFVCSGNICRSPMAEGYLRWLGRGGAPELLVHSAGTLGIVDRPASELAAEVAAEDGVELSGHRSRALTPELLREADVVVVMEHAHAEAARALEPEAEDKVVLLGQYVDDGIPNAEPLEIPDPIGRPRPYYERSFELIREGVEGLYRELQRRAGEGGE